MPAIRSQARTASDEYRANLAHNAGLCRRLREVQETIAAGGGEKAQARHREQGKLPVRERIASLCDSGTPFVEVGMLAAFEVYAEPVP